MSQLSDTAVVLLASGLSSRFEAGDKLLADLNGRPVLSYAGALMPKAPWRFAVTPSNAPERTACLETQNWTVLRNEHPELGQSRSLSIAMEAVAATPVKTVVILLGDMPLIEDDHLLQMLDLATEKEAVMSRSPDALMPPAVFTRPAFTSLVTLAGDKGARGVFEAMESTATFPIASGQALDIDTRADLQRASGGAHV